jgi:hypothetical protein
MIKHLFPVISLVFLVIGAITDRASATYCHNDPVNNVDVLGLESVPVYKSQIAEAAAKLGWAPDEHARRSAAIDTEWGKWLDMFVAAEAAGQKGDPRLMDTIRNLTGIIRGGHELNDMWLNATMNGAEGRIDIASAGINRIYRQSSFMEWVSGRDAGSIDPAADPAYFDDDNPDFKGDEWTRRFIQFNPGGTVARHAVNGQYGAASYEFGKEVVIWSSFGIAGEFVGTGRVAFGVTRGGMGGGIPANFIRNTRFEVEALQMQSLGRAEAFAQIRSFNAGNTDGFAFHFTNPQGAAGILGDRALKGGYGMAGRGVYAGTTPTPSVLLKYGPTPGWSLTPIKSIRMPIRVAPDLLPVRPLIPFRTQVFRVDQVPLKP